MAPMISTGVLKSSRSPLTSSVKEVAEPSLPMKQPASKRWRSATTLGTHSAALVSGFALAMRVGPKSGLASFPALVAFQCLRFPLSAMMRHVLSEDAQNMPIANKTNSVMGAAWQAMDMMASPIATGVSLGLCFGPSLAYLAPHVGACVVVAGAVIALAVGLHISEAMHCKKPASEWLHTFVEQGAQACQTEIKLRMGEKQELVTGDLAAASQAQNDATQAWRRLGLLEQNIWNNALDAITLGRSWRRLATSAALVGGTAAGLYGVGAIGTAGLMRMAPAVCFPLYAAVQALQRMCSPVDANTLAHGQPAHAINACAASQALCFAALVGVVAGIR